MPSGNGERIKQYQFTSDQDRQKAAENGRKGAEKMIEVKREKKRMLKALEIVLSSPVAKNEQIFGDKTTQLMLGMYAISEKMKAGDVKAAEFIRDLMGEKNDIDIPDNATSVVRERVEIVVKD